jgi:hypothetical protein
LVNIQQKTLKNTARNVEEDCTQPSLNKKEYVPSVIEILLQKAGIKRKNFSDCQINYYNDGKM